MVEFEVIDMKKIQCGRFQILTVHQFLEHYHSEDAYGWVNGFLVRIAFYDDDVFDTGIQEGVWKYRSITVAPLPEFCQEIQTRFTKKPIFDMTGSNIMDSIGAKAKEMCP